MQLAVRKETGEGIRLTALRTPMRDYSTRAPLETGKNRLLDQLEKLLLLICRLRSQDVIEAQRLSRLAFLRAHLDPRLLLQDRNQGRRLFARSDTTNEL
jgi:hypothetical protein